MFQLSFSRMYVDFICKGVICVSTILAFLLPKLPQVDCLSVPNLCMLEQRRMLNVSLHVKKRQEDQIIDTIDTICGSYSDYIKCFVSNLPNSDEIGDRFSRLMYQPESMYAAYRGLCTKDLTALHQIKACLVVTPELAACYKKYEKGVKKVIEFQDMGQFTTHALERLACNISVGRYKCETKAYGKCNTKARDIMQNFIYASLSDKCRNRMGVTSSYIQDVMNDGSNVNNAADQAAVAKTTKRRCPNISENSASSSCSDGMLNKLIKKCLSIVISIVASAAKVLE